ncbi:MAG: hypothetical protein JL50_04575 [Peptococcaceae bacterium BICA1-7]|nr:MAG: hypothetical protein JL50_04575 [Peptococcaceae bacterium BICA1-7]HBV95898.1 hypothetical protein [Desulfotomaculum sp.]
MQIKPIVLVEPPEVRDELKNEGTITVIAVYSGEAPISVATQRIFDGRERFRFPTEITEGTTKTRLVYSYSPEQWSELLETCAMPAAQAGIKQVMIPLLLYFQETYPDHFGEIQYDVQFDRDLYGEIVKLK